SAYDLVRLLTDVALSACMLVSDMVVLGDAFEVARTGCCAISRAKDDATITTTNDANSFAGDM
ncbi:MAG: hypothetical protein M3146_06930, partial [Thermoproteota archaeon]|nr:hypothetical protein [Thermoproteota archaeon]